MSIKFGIFTPQGWRRDLNKIADPYEQYEAMTTVGKVADAGSWDSIWVYDHFHTTPYAELDTTFECWTITSTLARDTKRVNVGQMVGCNGYRNPALYAKISSTVDVASNGRLYAGIGAGWYEAEWKAYGYPWAETPQRMGMFREAVQIITKMWTEDYPEFQGKYYTIDKPINEPKGIRKPHPMFWIGGSGEQVTLKLVAQYGDACNVMGDVATVGHKLDVLKGHCDTVGRSYDDLVKSTPDSGPPDRERRRSGKSFRSGTAGDPVRRICQWLSDRHAAGCGRKGRAIRGGWNRLRDHVCHQRCLRTGIGRSARHRGCEKVRLTDS
jgi:F420-dependent oxidoreductase-like protein